jgi:CRISPR-associated protein Csd2
LKGLEIFVRKGVVLDDLIASPYEQDKETKAAWDAALKAKKGSRDKAILMQKATELAMKYLCEKYADLRWFGGVLNTGDREHDPANGDETGKDEKGKRKEKSFLRKTAGTVHGPVCVTEARSINRIFPIRDPITRCCVTNAVDEHKRQTMGEQHRVPYGLYRFNVYFEPLKAEKSGFTNKDLETVCEALMHMYDFDKASGRSRCIVEKAFMFSHESKYGNARDDFLENRVTAVLNPGVTIPMKTADYTIGVDIKDLPKGVSVKELKWECTE